MSRLSPTTIEKIFDSYQNKAVLTEHEQVMAKRLELAYACLNSTSTKTEAVRMFEQMRLEFGDELSRPSCWIYIKEAEALWGKIQKYNKEFLRVSVIESAREMKEKFAQVLLNAIEYEDERLMKVAAEQIAKADERIIKAAGLDKDDSHLPDWSKLERHEYTIELDKFSRKVLEQMGKSLSKAGGVLDLSASMNIEQIDYQEVKKGEEED